jgi:hypothetical protein
MDYPWTYCVQTQTVKMHRNFNSQLTGLPRDTRIIIFEEEKIVHCEFSNFNQPIYKKNLPPDVKCIEFCSSFNQPINEDSLPDSITHLTFGITFKQSLDKLPNSLIFLELPMCYNQPINNLPYSLKTLRISSKYPIENIKVPFGCEIFKKEHGVYSLFLY